MTGHAPPPLEWHPFYRDRTWLLDWLERRGTYKHLDNLRLPRLAPLRPFLIDPDVSVDLPPEPLTLIRRKAWGPAPYVGRPFHYEWWVGTDQLGRHIAGEARIVYNPDWVPA